MFQPVESGIVPNLPIRKFGEGFREEESIYKAKLLAAEPLPPALLPLSHHIDWPVPISNPLSHLTAYPGDPNYSVPSEGNIHEGLDIQLPPGTPIHAPEDSIVTIVNQHGYGNEVHGFGDIMLYSETSGIVYWLVHIDARSIPDYIKQRHYFDKWSDPLRVTAGDRLGTVGEFFNTRMKKEGISELSKSVRIPEDVLFYYGRTYDHLDFETHYEPNIRALNYATYRPINPIKILKRLY